MTVRKRALRYEKNVKIIKGGELMKECMWEKEKGKNQTNNGKKKKKYMYRTGVSQLGLEDLRL